MATRLRKAAAAGLVLATVLMAGAMRSPASAAPAQIRSVGGASQLIVDGKPFLILGGELGNSSAGTAAQADLILPRLALQHYNTVLMPIHPGAAAR